MVSLFLPPPPHSSRGRIRALYRLILVFSGNRSLILLINAILCLIFTLIASTWSFQDIDR